MLSETVFLINVAIGICLEVLSIAIAWMMFILCIGWRNRKRVLFDDHGYKHGCGPWITPTEEKLLTGMYTVTGANSQKTDSLSMDSMATMGWADVEKAVSSNKMTRFEGDEYSRQGKSDGDPPSVHDSGENSGRRRASSLRKEFISKRRSLMANI